MEIRNLETKARTPKGSAEARRARRAGSVPAVVYGLGRDPVACLIDRHTFEGELKSGNKTFKLAIAGKSEVHWEIKVLQPGRFPIKVASSNGVTLTKTITIAQGDDRAGPFTLDLKGDYGVGKTFTVLATVGKPVPNQTLRLELPTGLTRLTGTEVMPVPPVEAGGPGSSRNPPRPPPWVVPG